MRVYMRDQNLVRRGMLPVLTGSAVMRLNDVSTFSFTVNANTDTWRRFQPGWGVIVEDEGRVLSGPVTKISTRLSEGGERDLVIEGVSDEVLLQDMFTLPTPSRAADQQDVDGYYTARGTAEAVMRGMVNSLIGPSARSEYRIDDLLVPASSGRGANVSVNTRFKILLEEMQSLAVAGNLNFRIDQEDRNRVLKFYEGRNYSRAVRITTVDAYDLVQEGPTITEVVVAGQGQGAARRMLRLTGNESPWGRRISRFQDRRDTDENEDLNQAGEETLAEGQEKASLSFEVNDQPGRTFLRDFTLGDTITVRLDAGITVTDVVQSAELSWDEHGRAAKLQVGPVPDEDNAPTWVKPVRDIARRLRGLEGI